ncbi:MAG TPA: ankyrin repeat domain-containing protein [Pirellulales bacterium]
MSDIHDAIEEHDLSRVEVLLRTDAPVIEQTNGLGNHPLHVAVCAGDKHISNMLLRFGADVNARGDMNRTPLHYAAIGKDVELAELLAAKGADLTAVDDYGNTPLYYSMQGELELSAISKILLKRGVSPDLRSAVWMYASGELRSFLGANTAVIETESGDGTALTDAVTKGDLDSVVALLEAGVPVDGTVSARPLVAAIGRPEILKKLIEFGADTSLTDSLGRSAIKLARTYGLNAAIDVLDGR